MFISNLKCVYENKLLYKASLNIVNDQLTIYLTCAKKRLEVSFSDMNKKAFYFKVMPGRKLFLKDSSTSDSKINYLIFTRLYDLYKVVKKLKQIKAWFDVDQTLLYGQRVEMALVDFKNNKKIFKYSPSRLSLLPRQV
jgi:hypothetical protein